MITDTLKFSAIIAKYPENYGGYQSFSERIGAGKSAVNNWERAEGKTINKKFRDKICEAFSLSYSVWDDNSSNKKRFFDNLPTHELQTKESVKLLLDPKMVGPKARIAGDEEDRLNELKQLPYISINIDDIDGNSHLFNFRLVELLKSNNQIDEALQVIHYLQNETDSFRYYYHNELEHHRAILLSHDSKREWDEAIHILRLLYSTSHYHLEQPEIVTLMASNYKRKALSDSSNENEWRKPEAVDLDLLANAASLYREAYNLKAPEAKYYDAVNLAYMYRLIEVLDVENELEDEEKAYERVKALAVDLNKKYCEDKKESWNPPMENWWEYISDTELKMLQGHAIIAKMKLEEYFESSVKKSSFDIDASYRQLNMYSHFSGDMHAKELAELLLGFMKQLEFESK